MFHRMHFKWFGDDDPNQLKETPVQPSAGRRFERASGAPNAGQDITGRPDILHSALRAARGENAENADLFFFHRKDRASQRAPNLPESAPRYGPFAEPVIGLETLVRLFLRTFLRTFYKTLWGPVLRNLSKKPNKKHATVWTPVRNPGSQVRLSSCHSSQWPLPSVLKQFCVWQGVQDNDLLEPRLPQAVFQVRCEICYAFKTLPQLAKICQSTFHADPLGEAKDWIQKVWYVLRHFLYSFPGKLA